MTVKRRGNREIRTVEVDGLPLAFQRRTDGFQTLDHATIDGIKFTPIQLVVMRKILRRTREDIQRIESALANLGHL